MRESSHPIRSARQPEFHHQRQTNDLHRVGSHAVRTAIGAFGLAAGAVMVAMVAYYGFATSDAAAGGTITAFWFAVIATGGIGGPAIAVHLFRAGHGRAKLWGLIAGIVAAVALVVNLSNSLGAIAGRADQTIAKRTDAKDARKDLRRDLERLTGERAALTFSPATPEDVAAAQAAVAATERTRDAECRNGRGRNCRAREAAEQTKREALAKVLANKALSDRAAGLDRDIATTRTRLVMAPAVAAIDPRAELLAKIFPVGVETAATGQQVATVVTVELLIAFALIAWELLAAPAGGLQDRATDARLSAYAGPAQGSRKAPATRTRTGRTVGQPKVDQGRGPGGPAPRAKVMGDIVDQLRERGGKLSGSSERGLAKLIGTSRSTTRRALHTLVAAGVVKVAGGALVLAAV